MNQISKKILKVVFIILVGFPSSILFYIKIEELIIEDNGGFGNRYRNPKLSWLFDYFYNLNDYRYTANALFSIIMFFLGFCFATLIMHSLNKLLKLIK
jgi:hypothetical protein